MTYLDYAATSPLSEVARTAWLQAQGGGNASAIHRDGRAARAVLEDARDAIASALGREAPEVIFTSGGTEADNLAVAGIASRGDIAVSAIEHPAVASSAPHHAARFGHAAHTIEVRPSGIVDLGYLADLLAAHEIAGVSVVAGSNETGIVQPLDDIGGLVAELRPGTVLHTDAVQAAGWLDLPGTFALSISGHKLGAPVGIGALVASRDFPLVNLEPGGGQERKVRSGTLNVAGAAALAAALTDRIARRGELATRLGGYRDRIVAAGVAAGGRRSGGEAERLPHIAHLVFEGADPEALIVGLDMAGISASAGSACSAGVYRPSPVLEAMGDGNSALRFSVGEETTEADIVAVEKALGAVVEMARGVA